MAKTLTAPARDTVIIRAVNLVVDIPEIRKEKDGDDQDRKSQPFAVFLPGELPHCNKEKDRGPLTINVLLTTTPISAGNGSRKIRSRKPNAMLRFPNNAVPTPLYSLTRNACAPIADA